ncbi:tetratricopeptide repeat protein [Chryseobacterium mulctrae]|uniref:tetratricopeptide repeat protein n=1 Tax=Chryseobacterium mulctrae TaxID=2576777 RepID=UPI00111612D7|nr:tetratricopeptide repeat protein [Chryseobacterium mulctrae]
MQVIKLIILYLLIFSGISKMQAQQYSEKEIDSLLNKEVDQHFRSGKLEESLVLCKEVIKQYNRINNNDKSAKAYLSAANICSNLFRIKESLQYLDLALEKNKEVNNLDSEARIYGEYGRNYYQLGFKGKALENYDKSISLTKSAGLKNGNFQLQYYYGLRAKVYEESGNMKAFYTDLKNAHKAKSNTFTSARLAKYFIGTKNLDSAEYYLNLGEQFVKKGNVPLYQICILKRNYGRYYFEKKEYQKAISFYEESLAIAKELNKPQDVRDTYKLLYEAYKTVKNEKKTIEHIENYTAINDSLKTINTQIQEIPVTTFIKEKEVIAEKSKKKLYIIIFCIIILFVCIFLFLRKNYIKKSHENEKQLYNKEEENIKLQQKVNESFDEVIDLAKTNSPEFFTRFKEVYPDIIAKLIEIDPKLRVTELTLLAYSYLGFNSKDVALYTFKSVNTVRSRKYNLRKKLNILPEENMELWLKNLRE